MNCAGRAFSENLKSNTAFSKTSCRIEVSFRRLVRCWMIFIWQNLITIQNFQFSLLMLWHTFMVWYLLKCDIFSLAFISKIAIDIQHIFLRLVFLIRFSPAYAYMYSDQINTARDYKETNKEGTTGSDVKNIAREFKKGIQRTARVKVGVWVGLELE